MLDLKTFPDRILLGRAAADIGADIIREALATHKTATIVVATGVSQMCLLDHLAKARDIDWSRLTIFHLDEYIGLSDAHPASFRRYLRERFLDKLPRQSDFVPIAGEAPDRAAEIRRLDDLIADRRIDLCLAGIGENCHLAFNDPPADFQTKASFIEVELDQMCRIQQLNEGWFPNLDAVPSRAISMSIHQILRSERILVTASETRKAQAIRDALQGAVSPLHPASALQTHGAVTMMLDHDAASLLDRTILS